MENSILHNRDYTLIIDLSSSMSTPEQIGGISCWQAVQESTLALARKCEEFDPDGLTVYLFSDRFQRLDHVTSAQVAQLFETNTPSGSTNLVPALQHAINHYFERKKGGQTKPSGETILVLTDGQTNDPFSVSQVIINATQKMERDDELAISFIQVGTDEKATRFLKGLDDHLRGIGAKYDICDTLTLEDMEAMSLTQVLLNAIRD